MLEFLRDPIWQSIGAIIGAIFGVAALLLTIVLYRNQRQKKAFTYQIIANTQLLTVSQEIRGRVKILLDDKPVKDVGYVQIRLANSGNVPILATDFVDAVHIAFDKASELLSYEVTETSPVGLDAILMHPDDHRILLQPMLLNPDDSIVIKVLVGQFSGQIQITGRIVGVKQIEEREVEDLNTEASWKVVLIVWLLAFVGYGTAAFLVRSPEVIFSKEGVFNDKNFWLFLVIVIASLAITYLLYQLGFMRKRKRNG